MRIALLALLAAILVAPAAVAAERPIVYTVVLDGLDGDRIDAGDAPFIASLLAGETGRATYYPESRSVMIAETNPNHTAMMTGAYGATSGIPGNAFALYAPLQSEDSCTATGPVDLTRLPSKTSGENADCPLAQTVFEAVKRQGNPDGLRTAAVLGKPKLGRIFAGKRFDGTHRDVDYLWAPCSSGADDDDYCGDVPTNPITGYAIDDATVMDEVLRTMNEGIGPEPLRRPDFTFVNLQQIDSAGHATGTDSGLYDATIGLADQQVKRLVDALKARGEWDRTVLIILSDHSMDTTPAKTNLTGSLTGAGISDDRFMVVQNGSVDAVYLADRTDPQRFELLKQLRAAALATPDVVEALYREPNPADGDGAFTLDGVHPGWHAAGERSGDLFVTHASGGAFTDPSFSSNPLPGNHGGPQTRDNFFAVTGGGGYLRQQRVPGTAGEQFDDTLANPEQAENVDPAPTIMGLLGLAPPRDSAGRFLSEAFDLAALPGHGAPAVTPRLRVKRLSCRRLRVTVLPRTGRHDLRVGKQRVLTDSARSRVRVKVRPHRKVRIRASLRSAAGAASPVVKRRVRTRRCR